MTYPIRKPECEELASELGVEIEDEIPNSGDLYIAGRNVEPKLLTCDYVDTDNGIVFPKETEYPFNTWECYRLTDEHQ